MHVRILMSSEYVLTVAVVFNGFANHNYEVAKTPLRDMRL